MDQLFLLQLEHFYEIVCRAINYNYVHTLCCISVSESHTCIQSFNVSHRISSNKVHNIVV